MRQRLLITDGDTYRLRSFGLYRLEEMVRYIRFPIPPLATCTTIFCFCEPA